MHMGRFFQDARDFQILFLITFLCLGVWNRDWTVHPHLMAVVIATSLLMQEACNRFLHVENPSLKSVLISAISLCLLLRANSVWTMVLAGAATVLSKFIFRYRKKHFFNPSNFGIIVALLVTGDAWVTPGQWGQEVWLTFLFLATGAMVVRKVGRWDTTGAFLGTYAAMEAARNYWLG